MTALAPCPCGKVPSYLWIVHEIVGDTHDDQYLAGECCGDWIVWVSINKASDRTRNQQRIDAWNSAPRGKE